MDHILCLNYEYAVGSHMMELAMKMVQSMLSKLSQGSITDDGLSDLPMVVSFTVCLV